MEPYPSKIHCKKIVACKIRLDKIWNTFSLPTSLPNAWIYCLRLSTRQLKKCQIEKHMFEKKKKKSGQRRDPRIKSWETILSITMLLIRNHLIKDRKFSFEPCAYNFLNFFIGPWFLSSKLIAWKCQDFKP